MSSVLWLSDDVGVTMNPEKLYATPWELSRVPLSDEVLDEFEDDVDLGEYEDFEDFDELDFDKEIEEEIEDDFDPFYEEDYYDRDDDDEWPLMGDEA